MSGCDLKAYRASPDSALYKSWIKLEQKWKLFNFLTYLYEDIVLLLKHPDNYIKANPMSTPLSIHFVWLTSFRPAIKTASSPRFSFFISGSSGWIIKWLKAWS